MVVLYENGVPAIEQVRQTGDFLLELVRGKEDFAEGYVGIVNTAVHYGQQIVDIVVAIGIVGIVKGAVELATVCFKTCIRYAKKHHLQARIPHYFTCKMIPNPSFLAKTPAFFRKIAIPSNG